MIRDVVENQRAVRTQFDEIRDDSSAGPATAISPCASGGPPRPEVNVGHGYQPARRFTSTAQYEEVRPLLRCRERSRAEEFPYGSPQRAGRSESRLRQHLCCAAHILRLRLSLFYCIRAPGPRGWYVVIGDLFARPQFEHVVCRFGFAAESGTSLCAPRGHLGRRRIRVARGDRTHRYPVAAGARFFKLKVPSAATKVHAYRKTSSARSFSAGTRRRRRRVFWLAPSPVSLARHCTEAAPSARVTSTLFIRSPYFDGDRAARRASGRKGGRRRGRPCSVRALWPGRKRGALPCRATSTAAR